MSWDNVYSWSQALAVFFAVVALVSGFVVNKQQGKEIAELKDSTSRQVGKNLELEKASTDALAAQQRVETELEKQKERTAKSELALADVRRKQFPREIDHIKFIAALRGKPQMRVEILYQAEDPEAFAAAEMINRWLGKGSENDGAGWDVVPPRPINRHDAIPNFMGLNAPSSTKAGAWYGAGIVVNSLPSGADLFNPPNAIGSLIEALAEAGFAIPMLTSDPRMPADTIRLVIASKM